MKKHNGLIFIIAITLIMAVIRAYFDDYIFYLGGLRNENLSLTVMFTFFYFCWAFVAFAIAALILFCFSFRFGGTTKAKGLLFMMPGAIVVAFFASPILSCFLPQVWGGFLDGFEEWASKNIEIEEIQDWISDPNENHWWETKYGFYGLSSDLPENLPQSFPRPKLQYVEFYKSDLDDSKLVSFEWGGLFMHWGIVIGARDIEMPEAGWVPDGDDEYDEYRVIVKPGVYIYKD
jgi:hypothetical protein